MGADGSPRRPSTVCTPRCNAASTPSSTTPPRPGSRSASAPAGGSSPTRRRPGSPSPATRGTSPARCRRARPTALAIDTVPNISWEWMHDHCGAYGLRHFKYVNNEPWHVQPVGDPDQPPVRHQAAGAHRVGPPRRDIPPPTDPPPTTGVFTVNGYRIEVRQGSTGRMAKMCQQQINLIAGQGVAEDGNFGNAVRHRVEERAGRARRRRRRCLRPEDVAGVRERHQDGRPKPGTGTDGHPPSPSSPSSSRRSSC